jgi:hypothetical protein
VNQDGSGKESDFFNSLLVIAVSAALVVFSFSTSRSRICCLARYSTILSRPGNQRLERIGARYVSGWTRAWLKTKKPNFERR